MLTGNFTNTLDDKGRISLPSRLRSELPGSSLIIANGVDRCLWVYVPEEWDSLSRKIMDGTSPFYAQSRSVMRRIISTAQEIEIDKTGRIAIPASLRKYARLNSECIILAIQKYIEIWDADEYQAYLDATEDEFLAATESLGGLLL